MSATLTVDGKTIELRTLVGSEGEKAIDIKPLRANTGYITLDPGYLNTGACESSITFIDGEKGILRYRGIPIDQLAEKSSFMDVAYLLVEGRLPSQAELASFTKEIQSHSDIPAALEQMVKAFPRDAHPMAMLSAITCSLSTFYTDSLDPKNPAEVELAVKRLMGHLPVIAALGYRHSQGLPFQPSNPNLDYTSNFLQMMFSKPGEDYVVDQDVAKILDTLLVLHGDHEQNCSTTSVRVVGSSLANLYASISAGICALWGPLHGGANQEVLEMLQQIADDGCDVDKYVALARDKNSNFRLMGFGHRVYKNYDPRAKVLGEMSAVVLSKLKVQDPLLEIARKLEQVALSDSYFKERNLYPNVDFYSGIIYRALGIPVNMMTVMFALGRLPGWISQWKESLKMGIPISRPRQVYTGETERAFVPVSER
jgi:citrate synthase